MTHPEELLAEYVDGTLAEHAHREVERHLATCAHCREELELAGRARVALSSLTQLEVPPETVRPGLTRRRPARPDRARRVAWAAGLAAAASFAAIFALIVVSNSPKRAGPANSVAGAPMVDSSLTPGVVVDNHDYDADSIRTLAARLADQVAEHRSKTARADQSASSASPSTQAESVAAPSPSGQANAPTAGGAAGGGTAGTAPYAGAATLAGVTNPAEARKCLREGSGLSLAPLVKVIQTEFLQQPAYIGAFILDGSRPDRLVLWAVSRGDCRGLSHAEQPVP